MQTKKYTAAEQAENISKLIAILHTFTPDQLADFASAAGFCKQIEMSS